MNNLARALIVAAPLVAGCASDAQEKADHDEVYYAWNKHVVLELPPDVAAGIQQAQGDTYNLAYCALNKDKMVLQCRFVHKDTPKPSDPTYKSSMDLPYWPVTEETIPASKWLSHPASSFTAPQLPPSPDTAQ